MFSEQDVTLRNIPTSNLPSTSSNNLLGPYVEKMIDNFAYAPFTLGPINPINMEEAAGVALRQAGLRQKVCSM